MVLVNLLYQTMFLYDLCASTEGQKFIPFFVALGDLKKEGLFREGAFKGFKNEELREKEFREKVVSYLHLKYGFRIDGKQFLDLIKNGNVVFIFDALDEMVKQD